MKKIVFYIALPAILMLAIVNNALALETIEVYAPAYQELLDYGTVDGTVSFKFSKVDGASWYRLNIYLYNLLSGSGTAVSLDLVPPPSNGIDNGSPTPNFSATGDTMVFDLVFDNDAWDLLASYRIMWGVEAYHGTNSQSGIDAFDDFDTLIASTMDGEVPPMPLKYETYFDLLTTTAPSMCGAYVAPGVWKEFDCYNLAAIGKTTGDHPLTPSWRLIGGYWQWGRKGPDESYWYDTNTEHFAHGPTGSGSSEANSGSISSWDDDYAPAGAWSDSSKTVNDPCPDGFRIPTRSQWQGVIDNNTQSKRGSWGIDYTNYSSGRLFGSLLMLPAAGYRYSLSGELSYRGYYGGYWGSSGHSSGYAWYLSFLGGGADTHYSYRRYGRSVRCVAK